jgi:hypothetical protein
MKIRKEKGAITYENQTNNIYRLARLGIAAKLTTYRKAEFTTYVFDYCVSNKVGSGLIPSNSDALK